MVSIPVVASFNKSMDQVATGILTLKALVGRCSVVSSVSVVVHKILLQGWDCLLALNFGAMKKLKFQIIISAYLVCRVVIIDYFQYDLISFNG